MANVTFRSPVMAKDVTVYAVAGNRGTLLALAKEHKIPIPFDCGDGQCGSCLVEVTFSENHAPMGLYMEEKEKEMLRQLGKITPEEIENAETNDRPPRHRLACQYFVRNEDIVVHFDGDETLPAKRPAMSIGAGTFATRIDMKSVEMFLAYAISVEKEAALHFEEMAVAMDGCSNDEVAALFRQLGGYSRLHLKEAEDRADGMDIAQFAPDETVWPDMETPERTSMWAADPSMSKLDALRVAMEGERRGFEFYHHVSQTSKNKEVAAMAKEFATEESEHVEILDRWIKREEFQLKATAQ